MPATGPRSQRSTRALFLHTLLWFVVGALFVGGVFSYLGDSLYRSGIPDLLKMAFVVLVVGVGFAPLYRHFPWVFGGIGIIAAEADFRAPDLYRPVPETAATLRTVLERTRATGADIREGSGEALYVPSRDFISMPAFQAFKGADYFYNVAFHELTHWTGHKSRLDRDLKNRFGARTYAAEELVAELGAAFLSAEFGFDGDVRGLHRDVD